MDTIWYEFLYIFLNTHIVTVYEIQKKIKYPY
jgi:hypothetical protein